MKMGKIIGAGALVFVLSLVLNTAYYAVSAEGHIWEATRAEPLFELMTLNHVVFAVLLMAVYAMLKPSNRPLSRGFVYGVLMGLVMFVPTGLVVRAAWTVPITAFFAADIAFHAALTGLLGFVIALILREKRA